MKKAVLLGLMAVSLISLSACSSMNDTNGNAAAYDNNNNHPQAAVPFPDSSSGPAQVQTEANPAGMAAPPGSAGSDAAPGSPYVPQ